MTVVHNRSRNRRSNGPDRKLVSPVRLILIGISIMVVGFSIAVASSKSAPTNSIAWSKLVGKQAPSVHGVTLTGSSFDLVRMRGNFVLVNFFASWCTPCREETSAFKSFIDTYKPKIPGPGVSIVGVTVNDRLSSVDSFVSKYAINWPVLYDRSGVIDLSWGVGNPPQTFLIAPNGKVVTRIVGSVTRAGLVSLLSLAYAAYG